MAGRSAQVGFIQEVTYGTYIAPTRFLEFSSSGITLDVERIESQSLRSGTRVSRSTRWGSGRIGATGPMVFEVANKGFGLIFKNMLGASAITTPGGATLTRKHSHTLADPGGASLTIQEGIPDITNVARAHSYVGCKCVGWEITAAVGELLMLTTTWDARNLDLAQTLATASYATGIESFSFTGCTMTLAGSAFDAVDFTLTGNPTLKTDRYFLGTALKKEPIANALYDLSGSITAEYIDNTAYNRFVTGTLAAIVFTATGSLIEGSFNYKVEITLPAVRFDGSSPTIQGSELTMQELPFKVMDDGTNQPITLDLYTTDTAS